MARWKLSLKPTRCFQSQFGDRAAALSLHSPGRALFPFAQSVAARQAADLTKSGIMVGLGEAREEVMQVMDDMRSADIDFSSPSGNICSRPANMPRLISF